MDILNTILLVDDDDTTNLLNKYFAEAIDDTIDVVTAVNGLEALQFLENSDIEAIGPCLIILDVMMPIMDGWEFLELFNQRFDAKFKEQVTISILTGLDANKIAKKAKENPLVQDTVEKPLSDEKFRALIGKHYAEKLSQ
ncbi:two-component system response regulator [Croceitalea marina]|uniref:Two-component system response regulator n=1 Tax=Croceitalea marina TaxID=1775166 RepID=A0ABW5MRH2_9FLAO